MLAATQVATDNQPTTLMLLPNTPTHQRTNTHTYDCVVVVVVVAVDRSNKVDGGIRVVS
jgi:hypothetical protein